MNPDYNDKKLRIIAAIIGFWGYILFFPIVPKKVDRAKTQSVLIVKFDSTGC